MNKARKIELAEVFRRFGRAYRKANKLPLYIIKTMNAIEKCRTAALGGHIEKCGTCGHIRISYNSCRNRHCPKCQGMAQGKWINARKQDLLPVKYFHLVFTIPEQLNPIAIRNQKEIYNILFKASAETLTDLGKDPKYLKAEIGFISILHTWGQTLMHHPHIHCILPGGGLSLDKKHWVYSKKKYFLPVKVLSKLFRGKFLYYLKKAFKEQKVKFPGKINIFKEQKEFLKLIDDLYKKDWVVYCKPTLENTEKVIEYLGRYTHRVAITNNRIEKIENKKVTFSWKDYKDGSKNKKMTLDADEFIRRFLPHILPDGFMKIRHYGLLSNKNRNNKLKLCKTLLDQNNEKQNTLEKATEESYKSCPCCSQGKMLTIEIFQPTKVQFIRQKTIA